MPVPLHHEEVEYERMLQENLARVFSERDTGRRNAAIRELYADDAILYEPQAVVQGHAAISRTVENLLSTLPPDFVFAATGPALGHHGAGRLLWQGGPAGGPAAVSGTDVILVEDGKIASLFVFIDPASP